MQASTGSAASVRGRSRPRDCAINHNLREQKAPGGNATAHPTEGLNKGHNTTRARSDAASRGTLSPRQKQDLLFLARLAKTEGVSFEMHGVKATPALEPSASKGSQAKQDGRAAREASQMRLSEADSSSVAPPSQQRSDDRLREFQSQIKLAKWERLVKKVSRVAAHHVRSPVHCEFLAARISIRGKMLALMKRALAHHARHVIAVPAVQAFTIPEQDIVSPAPRLSRADVPWHEQLDEDPPLAVAAPPKQSPHMYAKTPCAGRFVSYECSADGTRCVLDMTDGKPTPGSQTSTGARAAPPPAKPPKGGKTRGGRSKRS